MPLSDLKIRKSKQRDKPYRISDGLGLYITIKPSGSKLWHFRYQFMGREKLLSLGTYPILSLADARIKRDEAKKLLADGVDPSRQKRLDQIDAATKARMTFKEVGEEYFPKPRGSKPGTRHAPQETLAYRRFSKATS